jgi:hypothetical protein
MKTTSRPFRFKDWLLEKWKAEGRQENDTQLIFCSEPVQPGGTGATSKDIRKALRKLKHPSRSRKLRSFLDN